MILQVKVKDNPESNVVSKATLDAIASSLCIDLPINTRLVTYSEKAPLETCLPWQQVDGCGTPIGKVKTYNKGVWE